MTLYQVIRGLEQIALTHPNIKSAKDGSIYDICNANPSIKYGAIVITQENHRQDEMFDHYGLIMFYVDRLVDDLEDNRLQIQSIGKQLIGNIVTTFCNEYDVDIPTIVYTPYTQRFQDMCGGMFARFELEIPRDIICSETFD